MRVLIGCEYSGIVASAFATKGHDVTSCDLLPNESPDFSSVPSFRHIQGDVFQLISQESFDMMIAFPPCTYLCKAQMFRKTEQDMLRTFAGANFVRRLLFSHIPFIAIENPIGWLNTNWRPPSQIVHASDFGSPYGKDICLWLKNLPPLITGYKSPGTKKVSNHVNSRMSQALKSKIKSKFFPEVAEAMSNQWTETYLLKKSFPEFYK